MSHQDGKVFSGPGPEAEYWRYVSEGRFMIQHCKNCSGYIYPPRALCPHCGSPDLEASEASGRGTVYSTTVVRRKPDRGGDYVVCRAATLACTGYSRLSKRFGNCADRAGERQIDGAEIAIAHGSGGVLSSQVTALLGTSATV